MLCGVTFLLSEQAILSIQLNDSGIRVCEVVPVIDYVVGNCQAFLTAGLSGQNPSCLLRLLPIAVQQSVDLDCLVAIDDENPVDEVS